MLTDISKAMGCINELQNAILGCTGNFPAVDTQSVVKALSEASKSVDESLNGSSVSTVNALRSVLTIIIELIAGSVSRRTGHKYSRILPPRSF